MIEVDTKDTGWDLFVPEVEVKTTSSGVDMVIFDSKSTKSKYRYLRAVISTADEMKLPPVLVNKTIGLIYFDQTIDGWLSLIRESLYSHPVVEDIFVNIAERDVDVWVVIPRRDIAVLHQLVDVEGKLLEMLVSGEHSQYLIDFHIIYRCGRNIEELVSNRAIRLPR